MTAKKEHQYTIASSSSSSSSFKGKTKLLTVQTNNREDETQAQTQHDHRVHSETGALVSVELEHSARRATGTGRASRRRSRIAQ
jgi:hypothetical protein